MPRIRTEMIILRKTPFQDSGLILAGLSAELGRLDVVLKGARSVGARKSNVADLFRVVGIEVNAERDGLQTAYSLDLIETNDDIALRSGSYLDACSIAEFALRNSQPGVECRHFASAVRTAFLRLSREEVSFAGMLVQLVFLYDHGFLPEPEGGNGETARVVERLLTAATGAAPMPDLPAEYLARVLRWVDSLCSHHGFKTSGGRQ
ncbi:MAG: hypothetical protein GXP32_06525 [Kiritimatiellaeota bacterium]|nr:hypothetical protein [Kiritimatiellota bacterium]